MSEQTKMTKKYLIEKQCYKSVKKELGNKLLHNEILRT